jgi:hypothetical protein
LFVCLFETGCRRTGDGYACWFPVPKGVRPGLCARSFVRLFVLDTVSLLTEPFIGVHVGGDGGWVGLFGIQMEYCIVQLYEQELGEQQNARRL